MDTSTVKELEDAYLLNSYADTTFTTILRTINEQTMPQLQTTTASSPGVMTTTLSDAVTSTIQFTSRDQLWFTTFDYIIFVIMLGLSALIGIYVGFFSRKKQDNTNEYLLGGKTMGKLPISASLIASNISGITLLGVPSEIYANGTQYWMFVIPAVAVSVAMIFIYLPVFYELQLTSSFTYLEKRYDRSVRLTASLIFAFQTIVYIPIVIYVPALAFGQVTGINLHIISPVICVICIFYTTVGGLRAVVWTDTLQLVILLFAIVTVIFLGLADVGGFSQMWETAEKGGRLIFFNMDPNPFLRSSFWTVSLGLSTMWISNFGINQSYVQRFLAVPNIKVAKNSVIIFTIGLIFIISCSVITGLLIYAKYENCDPVTSKKVKKLDQILAYYVMEEGSRVPGLPGLFISGIFSAALSSMSSCLNTLAGTLYEDFIRPSHPEYSEKTASNIMKIIVVVTGVIVVCLVFVVEHMGAVLTISIATSGVTAGTMLGMFTMGMTMRQVNTKGIVAGSIVSVLIVGTIMVGGRFTPKFPWLPLKTDGCDDFGFLNATTTATSIPVDNDLPAIFQLSFMYYSLLGIIIMLVVGYPVSLWTGGNESVDEILLTPMCRSKNYKDMQWKKDVQYNTIDLALTDLKKTADGV